MWRLVEISSTRWTQTTAFEHVPYFLKCPNCGKVHLYEHIIGRVDKMPTDIECPTCGTLMNWNNSVDIKA